MTRSVWQWNEHQQLGTDYASVEGVRAYDSRMATLRDVPAESARILTKLRLAGGETLLEVGTGTGAFARAAAGFCRRVIAVDISPTMLEYARQRAEAETLANIAFRKGGFLTYVHQGPPVDAVVSEFTLHHLPDLWKLVGLRRMAALLRPGGSLYLADVVFGDEVERDPDAYFGHLIEGMPHSSRAEMARHIRQEFSTFHWVMGELLLRAGFVVEESSQDGFLAQYLCRRTQG